MPYRFQFYINHNLIFQGYLHSFQCSDISNSGKRCNRTCCIGTQYCWQYLLYNHHLRIKASTLRNAGKGLFAIDKTKQNNAVIFKKYDRIIGYDGEVVDKEELQRRYRNNIAPYGIVVNKSKDIYEDGALLRGIGTLCNHKQNSNVRFSITRDNHVFLVATKPIKNGMELFVDYGEYYHFDNNTNYDTKYVNIKK
jgi:SET domain-containing protein